MDKTELLTQVYIDRSTPSYSLSKQVNDTVSYLSCAIIRLDHGPIVDPFRARCPFISTVPFRLRVG